MSLRKDFIGFSSSFSRSLPLDTLCTLTGQHFIIPFYHVVSDEACPHIDRLYSFKNTKQFEQDIDYLALHYQPIAGAQLPDVLSGKYKGKKIMLLTFDDGLRQMHDTVAPILLRKGIPAVFFLNSGFIDNKALMFRYKASLALNKNAELFKAAINARNETALKTVIADEMDADFESFLKDYKPYMNSEQIRSLIAQGFSIGSHSCSHPYYADLSLTEQISQTLDCLDILQKEFQIKEKLFAFPFTDHGVSKNFFEQILDSGKIDFSFGGAGIKKDIHPHQFQRVPMEGWGATAEQIIKSEYLYYLLRAPLFRNTIRRN